MIVLDFIDFEAVLYKASSPFEQIIKGQDLKGVCFVPTQVPVKTSKVLDLAASIGFLGIKHSVLRLLKEDLDHSFFFRDLPVFSDFLIAHLSHAVIDWLFSPSGPWPPFQSN